MLACILCAFLIADIVMCIRAYNRATTEAEHHYFALAGRQAFIMVFLILIFCALDARLAAIEYAATTQTP